MKIKNYNNSESNDIIRNSSGLRNARVASSHDSSATAPVEFHPIIQVPFAYEIHKFILRFIPRTIARVLATVWLLGAFVFCSSLQTVLSQLFTFIWKLAFFLFLPSAAYNRHLEFVTGLIFGFCARLFLLLNCITWPIFEVRHSSPSAVAAAAAAAVTPLSNLKNLCYENMNSRSRLWDRSLLFPKSVSKRNDECIQSDSTTLSSDVTFYSDNENDEDDSDEASYEESVVSSPVPNRACRTNSDPTAKSGTVSNYRPKKTVIMVNHLSNADGVIVAGVTFGWATKIVYKGDLHMVPFLGACMKAGRHIPIDFNSNKNGWGVNASSKSSMISKVSDLINMEIPVLVFPEGIRRRFNRMSPFRNGFFQYCIENNIEAYPMVIYGSQHSWPVGSFLVDFHPIYIAYDCSSCLPENHTIQSFMTVIRNSMVRLLRLCPGYNPELETPIETLEEFTAMENTTKQPLTFF